MIEGENRVDYIIAPYYYEQCVDLLAHMNHKNFITPGKSQLTPDIDVYRTDKEFKLTLMLNKNGKYYKELFQKF